MTTTIDENARTTTENDEVTLWLADEGRAIAAHADIMDLVGAALSTSAARIVVPRARLAPSLFDLSTGLFGELAQKMVNYHVRLVVVGDTTREQEQSRAFRDFVREANRGRQLRFVVTVDELAA